jgi:cytidine deaminase
MTLGDQLRETTGLPEAAAYLALLEVRGQRTEESEGQERHGVVTIIRSAKRDEEVDLLRLVYGARLLVVGVSSAEQERRSSVADRLQREHHDQPELWAHADLLLARDQADEENDWGQRLRKAFAKADAFLWLRKGKSPEASVQRLVKLWFGEPFTTPAPDEQAMFHASAAQFRSAAAGRQVGVAVVDGDGEVLATGTNGVPKPGGGQYWPGDDPDHRDFRLSYETNDRGKRDVVLDVIGRLAEHGWLTPDKAGESHKTLTDDALAGPLKDSRIRDLIEFGRIVHAEMAAICTAARRGTPLRGADLFSTTYPCHECARLIIATGIRRVVFIDPYPKSQVQTLFSDLVTSDPTDKSGNRVQLVPFEGIAPRLFPDVFKMNQRARTTDGTFETWKPVPLVVRGSAGVPTLDDETTALEVFYETDIGQAWLDVER